MGSRWRTWAICLAGLSALAAATPWAVSSAPTEPHNGSGASEPPVVRLDFVAAPDGCALCPASHAVPPIRRTLDPNAPKMPPANGPTPGLLKPDSQHGPEYSASIDKLYPPLPPTDLLLPAQPGPDGRPLTLDALERAALANSPLIRQAAVDAPINSPATFVNLDALMLARQRHLKAIAAADRELMRLTLLRVESEVLAGVRHGYFAVLAAQQSARALEDLTHASDDAYRMEIERVKAGHGSAADPLQLRSLAYQSRAQLVQARNRYLSAWKQLAATVGRLDLPPTILEASLDRSLPALDFEAVHAVVLTKNSEVIAADYEVVRAENVLKSLTSSPLSIFHRAAAARARAELARTREDPARLRMILTTELADAFERYDSQRRVVAYYRDHVLPDLIKCHHAMAARPLNSLERVSASEPVVAQQALANANAAYLKALGEAWFAVVDIGRLTQAPDLFEGLQAVSELKIASSSALPSCNAGPSAMHWPEIIPSFDEPPASLPRFIPGLNAAPPVNRTPDVAIRPTSQLTPAKASPPMPIIINGTGNEPPAREAARPTPPAANCAECPVSSSVLVAPLATVEKSTKRRRFFNWPIRRDSEPPMMLPQEDEPPCAPKADSPLPLVAPKNLPQPKPQTPALPVAEFTPAIVLPELPTKPTAARKAIPLPRIIDGPVAPPKTTAAPPAPRPEIIMPIAATQKTPRRMPEIINGTLPPPTAIPTPAPPTPPAASPPPPPEPAGITPALRLPKLDR